MRRRPATTHSRSSSRAGSSCARSHPGRGGNARTRAGAAGLSLRPRSRSSRPCLRSPSPRRRRIIRHGSSIGQPLTRRDGVLKVTGARPLRRRQSPARHAVRRPGGQQHRARPRHRPRRRGGQGASRRGRGDDAGEQAAARAGPGREAASVHVPARPAAERPRALRQPADRGGDRRDAGGRDRRRRAAVAALRDRAGAGRAWMPTRASFRPRSASATRPRCITAMSRPASRRRPAASRRPTRRRAQYHNAMEPHAIVAAWDGDTLSIDTPSQGLAMAQGRIAGLFGIAPENIHIRSPFLGGGFGSQGPDLRAAGARHHGGPPGRPAGQAGAAARADVRPRRPSRADPADAAPGRRRATAR